MKENMLPESWHFTTSFAEAVMIFDEVGNVIFEMEPELFQ